MTMYLKKQYICYLGGLADFDLNTFQRDFTPLNPAEGNKDFEEDGVSSTDHRFQIPKNLYKQLHQKKEMMVVLPSHRFQIA